MKSFVVFGIASSFLIAPSLYAQTTDEPAIDPSYFFVTPPAPTTQQSAPRAALVPSQSDIVLVWEASGYVPPFYRGKKLYTVGTDLTVAALPDIVVSGNTLSSSQMVFLWEQDSTPLGSQSGLGKSSITLPGKLLARTTTVSVSIATPAGDLLGSERITIPLSDPLVLVYEENPALGTIFSRAVMDTHVLEDEELTLAAYPYFFDTVSKNSLLYTWNLGTRTETNDRVTLRTAGVSGLISVTASVKNPTIPGQHAETHTTIEY